MIKIVFLGSRPLGFAALQILQQIPSVQIVGCVTKGPPPSAWWSKDPHDLDLPQIAFENLNQIEFDLGVSINFWKIIPPELIRKPRMGFINLHHSYNLSLRGRDMTTHAILNARDTGRWYHGTTLHYTDDGLDTGPIIASEACPIDEFDTAWTLFEKVEKLGLSVLEDWLPRLLQGRPPLMHPEADQPLNLRQKEQPLRFIPDLNDDPLRSYDIVRAFDFNGHYEPASTVVAGEKLELTTRDVGGPIVLELGGGRFVYGQPVQSRGG